MFRYFCSLFLKYDRPIYPIVVFSYDSPKRQDKNNFVVDFPNFQVLNFNYKVVQLNRLDWREFLKQPNPVAAALMSKMNVKQSDRPMVKAECLRLLISLKLNPAKQQLVSGFIDTYLRLNRNEEQAFQSQLDTMNVQQKEQIMQLTTSWKEEGRIEGQVNTILRLLNRKLGSLPSEITFLVKSLDENQLDVLTEDLLDFQSLEDLNRWLESH